MENVGSLGGQFEILLVEDSPGDVRLTVEAFRGINHAVHVSVATDGAEAMAFLRREGIHAYAPRPDLILLDLNMPKMDGRAVLARLKTDRLLSTIPTIILTTSDAETDIAKCYEFGANSYMTKPVRLDQFEALVKSIDDYWFRQIRLPMQRQRPEASIRG